MPAVVRQQQRDGVPAAQGEGGHGPRRHHAGFERGVRRARRGSRRRARVRPCGADPSSSTVRSPSVSASISRSIRPPVLAVDFQSTRLSGSPATWGRMPRNSHASRVGSRRRPPPWRRPVSPHGAQDESSSSRGATVRRSGSPAVLRAPGEPERVLDDGGEGGQTVHAAVRRRRASLDRPPPAHGPLVYLDGAREAGERAGPAAERDAQPGDPAAKGHGEGHAQCVTGHRLVRARAPRDGQPLRTGGDQHPGDEAHGGQRQRDEVELPGAQRPGCEVRRERDAEERASPESESGHLSAVLAPAPPRGCRPTTSSSAPGRVLASVDRMIRWLRTRRPRSLMSCGTT